MRRLLRIACCAVTLGGAAAPATAAEFRDYGFRSGEADAAVLTRAGGVPPDAPADALPDGVPAQGVRDIAAAWLVAPTDRYGHAVLGDGIEAGGIEIITRDRRRLRFLLEDKTVFEDVAPRLVDLDGDGRDELVTIHSDPDAGAALAVLGLRDGELRLLAETAPIGTASRWLNPAGAGDFDGDGETELAYIQTPHIGGVLHLCDYASEKLDCRAVFDGVSNHAAGTRALGLAQVIDIDNDGFPDLVLPDAGRTGIVALGFAAGGARVLARRQHDAEIVTDFSPYRDGFAYGLADGRVVTLYR